MAKGKPEVTPWFPSEAMSGVIIMHDGTTWSGWVRKQSDATSYRDHYVQAPTQTSMMELIRTIFHRRAE